MTKQEFLEHLQRALGSRVSGSVVQENVSYYEEYIAIQVRAGKKEEEVIAGLGDPRLLARSIADAHKRAETAGVRGTEEETIEQDEQHAKRGYKVPGWLIISVIMLIIFLLLGGVFKVIAVLSPYIIPLVIIVFFIRLLRSK